jgi:hypothetical protein
MLERTIVNPSSTKRRTGPPWKKIAPAADDGDTSEFVDPSRLSRPDFRIDDPKRLGETKVREWVDHILKGERGEIEESKRFQWVGETAGPFVVPTVPRRL